MLVMLSAILFSVLIGVVVLFQLLLAAGMPWGSYAMGGRFPGKFPPAMRLVALIQGPLLLLLPLIVLSKAAIALPVGNPFGASAIWFVVAFSVVATVLNLITRSAGERKIWAPVSILLLITSIVVAVE